MANNATMPRGGGCYCHHCQISILEDAEICSVFLPILLPTSTTTTTYSPKMAASLKSMAVNQRLVSKKKQRKPRQALHR